MPGDLGVCILAITQLGQHTHLPGSIPKALQSVETNPGNLPRIFFKAINNPNYSHGKHLRAAILWLPTMSSHHGVCCEWQAHIVSTVQVWVTHAGARRSSSSSEMKMGLGRFL